MATNSALISAAELQSGRDAYVVIDASWHMPSSGRNGRTEYLERHIKGAAFFDLDVVSDRSSLYPHMLPSPTIFAEAARALGVSGDSRIVVYDSVGLFSAARLWWMFRYFGHDAVYVLDGGLPAWNGDVVAGEGGLPPGNFSVTRMRDELLATIPMIQQGKSQICDARSAGRFSGAEPEPRAGLKSGHIPGAKNVHYSALLKEGKLLPKAELKDVFERAGIVLGEPIITSCGSGVTACILALALYELGYPRVPVYDGSWAEWGSGDNPVATLVS